MTRREFCIAAVAATAAAKVLAVRGATHPKVAMAWTQPYAKTN